MPAPREFTKLRARRIVENDGGKREDGKVDLDLNSKEKRRREENDQTRVGVDRVLCSSLSSEETSARWKSRRNVTNNNATLSLPLLHGPAPEGGNVNDIPRDEVDLDTFLQSGGKFAFETKEGR